MDRWEFYKKSFLKNISKDCNFLLISGSEHEIDILRGCGYNKFNVTFHNPNQEKKLIEKGFSSKKNLFQSDVRDLNFENNSFDYVITNATLHHVDLPHKAITEMYRVSKKGVLIIESNDSFVMRIACKLKLAEEFEISSVDEKSKSGGLLDKGVPNYVYRWTEREIIKLIKSYKPEINHKIYFDYGYQLKFTNSLIIKFIFKLFFLIFKKQQNLFSIYIEKDINKIEFNTWYKK